MKIPGKITAVNTPDGWMKTVTLDDGKELTLVSMHRDSHYVGGHFRPVVILECYFEDYSVEVDEIAQEYRNAGYFVNIVESQKLYLRQVVESEEMKNG